MKFEQLYNIVMESVEEKSPYKPCPKCGSGNVWNGPQEGYEEGNRYRGSIECWDCKHQWAGFNWKKDPKDKQFIQG